jgi:hypothetical protein
VERGACLSHSDAARCSVDKSFTVFLNRGKGSHRMLVLGANHYPFPCHDEGSEIDRRYLRDIIRRFGLPADIFD